MVQACRPFSACHGALTSTLTPLGLQAQECVSCPAARPRHSLKAAFWTCCPGVYQVACVQPFPIRCSTCCAFRRLSLPVVLIRDVLSISCAVGASTFQCDLEITYSRLTYVNIVWSSGFSSMSRGVSETLHYTIVSLREGYRKCQHFCCEI